ncbi:hypothetical protein IGS68_33570 (plasmid) [Skermanella sp. TT6]|uniref:Uncharacterized protein n=1 Tax=Skermanella cutis TaxID=2775420 RepID=A0ABX7BGN3_9PROT|nr:hypothetical protein [Skermanella sp. TT6]QQP93552.1 hypothetical protein IGS68_33570 [Skermanella sp. TT6]
MLTSLAGSDHSFAFGEIVDLPDPTALAWIEAGIAAAISESEPAKPVIEEATAPAVPEKATIRRGKRAK